MKEFLYMPRSMINAEMSAGFFRKSFMETEKPVKQDFSAGHL